MSKEGSGKKARITAVDRRGRANRLIQKLKLSEKAEDKKRVAALTAALEKQDDELEGTNIDEEMDAMDIDQDDADGGGGTDGQGDNNEQSSAAAAAQPGQTDNDKQSSANTTRIGSGDDGQATDNTTRTDPGDNGQAAENTTRTGSGDDRPQASTATPKIKIEAPETLFVPEDESESDSDDGTEAPLYTRRISRPGENVTTVAWSRFQGTHYINRYGKKSFQRYRLDDLADTASYENAQSECVQSNQRGGDLKLTKRHVQDIFGVAWKGVDDGNSEDNLALINPKLHATTKWPTTYVRIGWMSGAGGQIDKRWETRSTLRRLWGVKAADMAIYNAACNAEAKYNAAKNDGDSRSPSVGLVGGTALRFRQESLAASKPQHSRGSQSPPSRRGTPDPAATASESKEDADLQSLLVDFRSLYLETEGVRSISDLSREQKKEFFMLWKEEKKSLIKDRK